jgi:hypothetical protein
MLVKVGECLPQIVVGIKGLWRFRLGLEIGPFGVGGCVSWTICRRGTTEFGVGVNLLATASDTSVMRT